MDRTPVVAKGSWATLLKDVATITLLPHFRSTIISINLFLGPLPPLTLPPRLLPPVAPLLPPLCSRADTAPGRGARRRGGAAQTFRCRSAAGLTHV